MWFLDKVRKVFYWVIEIEKGDIYPLHSYISCDVF